MFEFVKPAWRYVLAPRACRRYMIMMVWFGFRHLLHTYPLYSFVYVGFDSWHDTSWQIMRSHSVHWAAAQALCANHLSRRQSWIFYRIRKLQSSVFVSLDFIMAAVKISRAQWSSYHLDQRELEDHDRPPITSNQFDPLRHTITIHPFLFHEHFLHAGNRQEP